MSVTRPLAGNSEPSARISVSCPAGSCLPAFGPGDVFRFGHLEADPHGIERNDGGERLRRRGRHQPAHRHQRIADAAADGRANGAVLEIQLGGVQRALARSDPALGGSDLGFGGERGLFDGGLVGLHGLFGGAQRGDGGVEILLRSGVGGDQRLQTFVVLLRLHQVRLRGGQARLRLQQRNLLAREIEVGLALPQVAARLLHAGLNGRRSSTYRTCRPPPPRPAGRASGPHSPSRAAYVHHVCVRKFARRNRKRWQRCVLGLPSP